MEKGEGTALQLVAGESGLAHGVLEPLPSLDHAGTESDAVAIWMFWLCYKAQTRVPACQMEGLGMLTQRQPTPSRFVATPGMSSPPFSQPHGQGKCWDRQLCPTERDGLGQSCAPDCCRCVLAPSVPGKGFQQSSENLLAQPFSTVGQFPSAAKAPVSQLEHCSHCTSAALAPLAFSQVVFPKNTHPEG